jgi:hypothetical protein
MGKDLRPSPVQTLGREIFDERERSILLRKDMTTDWNNVRLTGLTSAAG